MIEMADIVHQNGLTESAGGLKKVVWVTPHVTITLEQTDADNEFGFVQVREQLRAFYGDPSAR